MTKKYLYIILISLGSIGTFIYSVNDFNDRQYDFDKILYNSDFDLVISYVDSNINSEEKRIHFKKIEDTFKLNQIEIKAMGNSDFHKTTNVDEVVSKLNTKLKHLQTLKLRQKATDTSLYLLDGYVCVKQGSSKNMKKCVQLTFLRDSSELTKLIKIQQKNKNIDYTIRYYYSNSEIVRIDFIEQVPRRAGPEYVAWETTRYYVYLDNNKVLFCRRSHEIDNKTVIDTVYDNRFKPNIERANYFNQLFK